MPGGDRWPDIERVYNAAVDLPPGERNAFLETACAGDDALRRELDSLLADDGPSFLEREAIDVAARDVSRPHEPSWVGRKVRGYEILGLIGVGGMGEVYRARDTTLGRDVALKLLPGAVASDPERLRRLEREARLLASLNHPRIATVHALEECDGQRFLVMELVEGETLDSRLRRRPLLLHDAIDVCRQIAEGLEAAHDAGIVHRDLKPANIVVGADGQVKLLDFGLARALDPPGQNVPSTQPARETTLQGTILGTPAYMSPEQARGEPVDRRTDIWAFGCCLFEALTGRRAYKGDTVTDTLAAVLDREPDWSALRDEVPEPVRRLLHRLLAKDVRHRLQHIGDARLELEDAAATHDVSLKHRRSRAGPVLAGVALIVALAATLAFWLRGHDVTTAKQPVTRLALTTGDAMAGLRLSVDSWFTPFGLSPDGERLVLRATGVGDSRLFIRELSAFETRPIAGTEGAASAFFSPDGRWIAFWRPADRTLRKVWLAGGTPVELAPTDVPHYALWATDDEIVVQSGGQDDQLWSIPADGGKPSVIVVRDRAKGERITPRALIPGTRDLLVASDTDEGTWLALLSRGTGTRRRLLRGGSNSVATYTPTGHLVYSDADTLLAVPVDDRFEPVGKPVPVLRGIDHYFFHANVALSATGTVVYLPADRVQPPEISWLDQDGRSTAIPGGQAPFGSVALSPNGREAVAELIDGVKAQLWILDLERGTKRMVESDVESRRPIWSRDGAFITYVAFQPDGTALVRRRADGSGTPEVLTRLTSFTTPDDWSPDGRSLLFSQYTSRGDTDIWLCSAGKTSPVIASPSSEANARFSPDGRFVAFDADDGGVSHVYLQPFPGPGTRTPVSAEGSSRAEWIDGGHRLTYHNASGLMVVDVETWPVLHLTAPRKLLDAQGPWNTLARTPDGHRFLALSHRRMEGPPELRVILNWFEELEQLAPHPQR